MLHNRADKGHGLGLPFYFYETWHPLDEEDDWRMRLDRDLGAYWRGKIMRPALVMFDTGAPIYLTALIDYAMLYHQSPVKPGTYLYSIKTMSLLRHFRQ